MAINFGVAVNYFKSPEHPESVKQSLIFALSQLKNCKEVTEIVVTDGSLNKDEDLMNYCKIRNIKYLNKEGGMSFPEAYNYGVSKLEEEWIAVMASDIYVFPHTFTAFSNFIENHKKLRIGCLIPYLSSSDFITQQVSGRILARNCYAGLMTFNLNVFRKNVYNLINGISLSYSGNYNDVEAVLHLNSLNLDTILVKDAYAVHYGRLTLTHGSNVNYEKDYKTFNDKHPQYLDKTGFWNVKVELFLKNPLLKIIYKLKNFIPSKTIKIYYINAVLKMIPIFQEIN